MVWKFFRLFVYMQLKNLLECNFQNLFECNFLSIEKIVKPTIKQGIHKIISFEIKANNTDMTKGNHKPIRISFILPYTYQYFYYDF